MVSYPTKCLAAIVLGAGGSYTWGKVQEKYATTGDQIGDQTQTIQVTVPRTEFQIISPVNNQYERTIRSSLTVEEAEATIPIYDIPTKHCSRYAAFATRDLFATRITRENAWNLKYHNESFPAEQNLENATKGDLITFHNPGSKHNTDKCGLPDEKGNTRSATHVGVLYGRNASDQPLILHQYINKEFLETLDQIGARNLAPVDVIRGKRKDTKQLTFNGNPLPPLSTDKPRVR